MKQDKIRNAELLFDAIGCIDDRIIQEAQSPYRASAEHHRGWRTLVAASISFAVLTVGVFGASLFADRANPEAPGEIQDGHTTENSQSSTQSSLAQTLLSATNGSGVRKVDVSSLDFFDGKTCLIWRPEGESRVCVLPISSQVKITSLKKEIGNASATLSPDAAERIRCQVWVSYGNGMVVSPYLQASAGNVGYGELFEYSPEIEPSEKLVELVDRLIES